MRIVPVLISAVITTGLIIVLNTQLSVNNAKTPRLGFFLSPQKGFWQNAEPENIAFNSNLKIDGLKGTTEVYFDERLVPHVFAENENDAYFVEGYLHSKFRLWQMEFQTYAAAGRLSEIMGDESGGTNFFAIDKYFRRLGMVYAAENSLREMESDPLTKAACDAYTAGVNKYISSLDESQYPIEYKLLDYKPEPWTNLKTALFLKYMSFDLAGSEKDFEKTNAKTVFTKAQFEKLFPQGEDSLDPIIPKGAIFKKTGISLMLPSNVDSAYFNYKDSIVIPAKPIKPNENNGSNNWAVAGSKTKSGRPILCNDPHLDLNLPSLWYEMQISVPGYNAYGVSFPGAPSIIIGFNDNCAWGFTNSERDVRDYYEMQFRDSTMQQYWYNGNWRNTTFRNEIIKIKNKPNDTEHIAMTVWGPVMYDKNYADKLNNNKAYACRWKAHDASNELQTFILLNHAKNFNDYSKAIATYQCPGQNMIFASKAGDIAIKQQGSFPAKWKRQGDFVMPGIDSSYAWRGMIPDSENIILHNPPRGFVSSANQYPYDTSYPYYLNGTFEYFRGHTINRNLSAMQNITVKNMQQLQTNNYNLLAEMARPALLKYINQNNLNDEEKKYLTIFINWNLRNDATEIGPTIFTPWWDSLMHCMYDDELLQSKLPMPEIKTTTLLHALLKDSAYEFADNINTPQKETMSDIVTMAFKKIIPVLETAEKNNTLVWGKFKDSGVRHLLKLKPFSRLDLFSGGGDHIINAYQKYNGPSWRMIVELTDETNAYGVYPGGQSGNPGSKYYDNFIDTWLAGKYYKLTILKKEEMQNAKNLKGKMVFKS
ncbi:MAG: penicillin acylase family protein [Chitinophagaceae bacterium]